jgi:hypothetical protein
MIFFIGILVAGTAVSCKAKGAVMPDKVKEFQWVR